MSIPTRDEVIAAVRGAFPADRVDAVVGLLDTYGEAPGERERERVQHAIVSLAGGDEARVRHLIGVAKTDYRDVLDWAARGPLTPQQGAEARAAATDLLDKWGKR